ncbi:hypothetical protein NMY22_g5373 [Coprinellus aureogranulatus]|nr:hypothetical protein NMY22_g5373 [Coprinellus aureogranulatus]
MPTTFAPASMQSRVTVSQLLQRPPQLFVTVLNAGEARLLKDNRELLLGTRTILRIDHKKSAVVYSNSVSDWNAVAAVARVRVSHEVIPLMDWAPPKTFRKRVRYFFMIILMGTSVTIVGLLIWKMLLHVVSVVLGFLFGITQTRVQAQLSARAIGLFNRLSDCVRLQIQAILRAIVAWLETSKDKAILDEVQKALVSEL